VTTPPAPDGPADSAPPPVCYRHPGRETYVSCTRCGRPACPDCLRSAAVGQQCVDCVRGGQQGTRRPAGMFGGAATSGQPVVTWTLVAINVILYLVELVHPALAQDWSMIGLAVVPPHGPLIGVANGELYRLVTSAFLPGTGSLGILDIAFNMWALIVVGPALEKVLGRSRYIAIYLASALGGSILYFWLAPVNEQALGASGAIFGLFGAWFVLARRLRSDSRQIVLLIVINLVFSFVYHNTIAWQAHVGGLIAGALLTAAFVYAPRRNRTLIQVASAVVLLAVLAVAVVVRDNQIIGTVRL
jgi:membrane associated rhomboid family serine protease